ncbi:hypothetical protein [Streptomyces radicis]|uniref:hypothetical protein n=1 Tax=Streptomyces radicis TaxID=1750517 RepID=UPI0011C480BE|nr:hypothetical protein [Streptomyces radicis]
MLQGVQGDEIRVPVGAGAEEWVTRGRCRRVLLVVHNVTAATRLLDILPLFRDDLRIQLLVTCTGSSPFQAGVPELFARLGLPVLPWEQAVRTPVDLAISASYGGQLHEIQGTLVVLSHGAGYNKTLATPNAERRTPNAERRTPNAERRTPNAERRTPNAERRGRGPACVRDGARVAAAPGAAHRAHHRALPPRAA